MQPWQIISLLNDSQYTSYQDMSMQDISVLPALLPIGILVCNLLIWVYILHKKEELD